MRINQFSDITQEEFSKNFLGELPLLDQAK